MVSFPRIKKGFWLNLYSILVNKLSLLPPLISEKERKELEFYLWELHLHLDPRKIASASLTIFVIGLAIGIIALLFNYYLGLILILLSALFSLLILRLPIILGKEAREKKRTMLLQFLLELGMFYKVTNNLETSFYNTVKHIPSPLREDLVELWWLINLRVFPSIEKALSWYTNRWEEEEEFVHAMYMILNGEVDEGLNYYLSQYYYKMLKFSRELKNAVEVLNMLGIVLPVMTMTLLPVIISVMSENVPYSILFVFYDFLLPLGLFILTKRIVEKKIPPTIYSIDVNILVRNRWLRLLLILPLFIVWLLIIKAIYPKYSDYTLTNTIPSALVTAFLAYSIVLVMVLYFIDIYKLIRKLDKTTAEITILLSLLSELIGRGLPLEEALREIVSRLEGLEIRNFVTIAIKGMNEGKSLKEAIQNALEKYPSPLLKSVFDIILTNIYAGNEVLREVVETLKDYLSKVMAALERMKDLLSEAISEMKLQVTMLIPIMLGVIVGIGVFMIAIMVLITQVMKNIQTLPTTGGSELPVNVPLDVLQMFMIKKETITPFMYQLLVGLYVIESVIIISYSLNLVENSKDPIKEKITIAKNLALAFTIYLAVVIGVTLMFEGMYLMLKGVLAS